MLTETVLFFFFVVVFVTQLHWYFITYITLILIDMSVIYGFWI